MCVKHVGVRDTHLCQKRIRFMLYCRIFGIGVGRNWLFNLPEMMRCRYSTTSSEVFVAGHSQGTIMSLAALIQPDIAELVEAAGCLYVICSEWGVNILDSVCDVHVDCLEWLYMILFLIVGVSVLCPVICFFFK